VKVGGEVYALDSTSGSFSYLLAGDHRLLIDTSMPGRYAKIIAELATLGVAPDSLNGIVLTHHDIDHMGNAQALKTASGAPLWASAEDRPYIQGQRHRPGIKRVVEMLMKATPTHVDHVFSDVPLGDLVAIATPGHTPGHTVFLYDDILFAGDLVIERHGRLLPSPGIMTSDRLALRASLKAVGRLEFTWVCPAHGVPVRRGSLWDAWT
jgi:glyoxylase-like metal-dependent hydrolase (beta-lactamase superfamily II)